MLSICAVLVMETLADTANSVVYKVLLLKPRTTGSREFVVPELEPEPKALKVDMQLQHPAASINVLKYQLTH